MKTCIEQLPIELWIEIFSYLEAHILLQAFTNLNHYFDQLITSDYLLFNVRLGKINKNPLEYSIRPYWSENILNRIISVRPIIQHKISHIPEFLRWHCTKLIQLKSLTMKLRGREISHVCHVLQQLNSLHYLSIECVPNQILLDGILAAPTLHICRLEFSRPITPIIFYSNNISNIEILDIKLEDDSYGSIINLLLSHMPKLKRLEYNNYDIYVKNREWIFFKSLFILPQLQTINVQCSSNYSSPIIFQNLHKNLPAIRRFYLNMNFDFINEDLLNNLIYHWWPIFLKIERINIFIKCQKNLITIVDNMQLNIDQFQSVLLAMNEQYDGLVKTEWTEKSYTVSKFIEISICKYC
ncbi:unnamed protein product [Rotaria sp. Silwood1]|nr:unnamed protein product [Rotaria sp. Silwood1]CAF3938583.1 unnamed protein product [Rotaria sp. Silwood1]CAF4654908.1 unnamed protein product [Rotaria sp. Silwood1]CAF4848464.1 unnamed protein product [Rotaria sp. Silwood1]